MVDPNRLASTFGVGLGGAIGSIARYWVGLWMASVSTMLPWGTIVINITGSFAIAFIAAITSANGRFPASDWTRLFFMAGLCGGYTTFSAFSLQSLVLLREGATGRAMLNIGLSVVLCLAAAGAGFFAGQALDRAG